MHKSEWLKKNKAFENNGNVARGSVRAPRESFSVFFANLHPAVGTYGRKVFGARFEGECAFVTQLTAARRRQGAVCRAVTQWRACALPALGSTRCRPLKTAYRYLVTLLTKTFDFRHMSVVETCRYEGVTYLCSGESDRIISPFRILSDVHLPLTSIFLSNSG